MSSLRNEYFAIKSSLGVRPTRTQMEMKLGDGFRGFLKDGWIGFLAEIGEFKEQESGWPGTVVEEFLGELETTRFQKSYKIPAILAFLTYNGIRQTVDLNEVAGRMMAFYHQENAFQKDFCDKSNRNWSSWTNNDFARLALADPIYYLSQPDRFFHYNVDTQIFYLDESLVPYLSPALATHVRDIMEYRGMKYLRKRYGDGAYAGLEAAAE